MILIGYFAINILILIIVYFWADKIRHKGVELKGKKLIKWYVIRLFTALPMLAYAIIAGKVEITKI